MARLQAYKQSSKPSFGLTASPTCTGAVTPTPKIILVKAERQHDVMERSPTRLNVWDLNPSASFTAV
jgi:hypothetical protein